MLKIISVFLLVGFCFAQDSTDVTLKLGEVGKMRIELQIDELAKLRIQVQNTMIMAQAQIATSQEDLSKIDYAEFLLNQLLVDPPEPKEEEKPIDVDDEK